MTTVPLNRNGMAVFGIATAGAISLGTLGRATLSTKTAAPISYCCHALASTLSLPIIRGFAAQCGRPITSKEVTVLGATSLSLSAALYLSEAPGAVLTLAVAEACYTQIDGNHSPQTDALASAVCVAQLIGLSSYTSFIPSCYSLCIKTNLVNLVILQAHQAIEASTGKGIDRQSIALLQVITTTHLVAFYSFDYISTGTLAAGTFGVYYSY